MLSKTKAKKIVLSWTEKSDAEIQKLTDDQIRALRSFVSALAIEVGPQTFAKLMHLDLRLMNCLGARRG